MILTRTISAAAAVIAAISADAKTVLFADVTEQASMTWSWLTLGK